MIFLISPAHCGGIRAGYLLRANATSALAARLRTPGGATIGEVFTFMSGLYFRGKLAYAGAFASPGGTHVIVPGQGLRPPDTIVDLAALKAIAKVPVDPDVKRYTRPLIRDAEALAATLAGADTVVLLGSLATPKYLGPLAAVFGDQLRVPAEFIGRGDMSRGALMLRCVANQQELTYIATSALPPKR